MKFAGFDISVRMLAARPIETGAIHEIIALDGETQGEQALVTAIP